MTLPLFRNEKFKEIDVNNTMFHLWVHRILLFLQLQEKMTVIHYNELGFPYLPRTLVVWNLSRFNIGNSGKTAFTSGVIRQRHGLHYLSQVNIVPDTNASYLPRILCKWIKKKDTLIYKKFYCQVPSSLSLSSLCLSPSVLSLSLSLSLSVV